MNTYDRTDSNARDAWLNLVCEGEVASMSASNAFRLYEGDEYIELGQLAFGVRRAEAASPSGIIAPERILPRKAVPAAVWAKLIEAFEEFRLSRRP